MTLGAVIKWTVIAVVVLVLGLPILAIVVLFKVAARHDAGRYDRNNSDYKYVTSQITEKEDGHWNPAHIDLSSINGGDWQMLCVLGGYNDPVWLLPEEAAKRSVKIDKVDPVERQYLGLFPVEENEGAISFVDGKGRGHTVLIDGFERLECQWSYQCFGRDTTEVTLPRDCP